MTPRYLSATYAASRRASVAAMHIRALDAFCNASSVDLRSSCSARQTNNLPAEAATAPRWRSQPHRT